ncbi:hypothetical protein CH63R_06835 [Colletotrichum higginsianum IMI 349063]|uniref:Uncharacterized protein n=1 Tax=Colletotrichum higginsianum (strain IMI 349063) TaxID=759273 RepID=A0A1B7YGD8_COLHI|nr:hypothetical protein CH63R_06835 [Colletotrichum higginsianum IMI 349063]OBR11143.1 hypothetical protein CH63R_06835 [Colletotrichum higginsianum IMI 349063]
MMEEEEEEDDDAIPSGFSYKATDAVEETRDQSKKPGEDGYSMCYYLRVKVTTQTSLPPTTTTAAAAAAAAAASLTVIVATAIHRPGRPITRGSIGVRLCKASGRRSRRTL